jgi:hypothetical protein
MKYVPSGFFVNLKSKELSLVENSCNEIFPPLEDEFAFNAKF